MNPWLNGPDGNLNELPKEWQKTQIAVQENCPDCGAKLMTVFMAIGGFPGHEHIHPRSLWGYQCRTCNCRFSLEELARKKAQKAQKEKPAWNYWRNVRAVSTSPYLPFLPFTVIGFILLAGNLWIGMLAGAVIVFVMPFLSYDFRKFLKRWNKRS